MKRRVSLLPIVCLAALAAQGCGSEDPAGGEEAVDDAGNGGADSSGGDDAGGGGEDAGGGEDEASGGDDAGGGGEDEASGGDDAGGGSSLPTEGPAGAYKGMLIGTSGTPYSFRAEARYDLVDPGGTNDEFAQRTLNGRFSAADAASAFDVSGYWVTDDRSAIWPLEEEGIRYTCGTMLLDGLMSGSCVSEEGTPFAAFLLAPDESDVEWFCGRFGDGLNGGVIVAVSGTATFLAVGARDLSRDLAIGASLYEDENYFGTFALGNFRFEVSRNDDGLTVVASSEDGSVTTSAFPTVEDCAPLLE